MTTTLDRLTPEDAAILRCEAGNIRGHTCKLLVLGPPDQRTLPTVDQLRAHIDARLDAAPRLRMRLVSTPLRVAPPVWLDDPQFDIAHHVRSIHTAPPVSRAELEQIVAGLMSERLDRARPLWQLNVVERLDDGSMALIWRIHHCMADGTTCVGLGSSVLWSDDANQAAPPVSRWTPRPPPGAVSLFATGLAGHRPSLHRIQRPGGMLRTLRSSEHVLKRELWPRASRTPLAQAAGSARRVGFASAPLERLRLAGKRIDDAVTLNDMVLAIMAGGIRTWLEQRHGPAEHIRVKVPVSLHHHGEGPSANRDSCFFVDLPVAETDPLDRVRAINRETTERKLDDDAETLYHLGRHHAITRWAMSPHVFTFNVSNVRGPQAPIYVLGAPVREMYSLAEIARHHALRVAVISSSDSLYFGLCADRDAVSDVDVLAAGLRRATTELLELAG